MRVPASDGPAPTGFGPGGRAAARFGFEIGIAAANQDRLPTWHADDEFLPAREASGVR